MDGCTVLTGSHLENCTVYQIIVNNPDSSCPTAERDARSDHCADTRDAEDASTDQQTYSTTLQNPEGKYLMGPVPLYVIYRVKAVCRRVRLEWLFYRFAEHFKHCGCEQWTPTWIFLAALFKVPVGFSLLSANWLRSTKTCLELVTAVAGTVANRYTMWHCANWTSLSSIIIIFCHLCHCPIPTSLLSCYPHTVYLWPLSSQAHVIHVSLFEASSCIFSILSCVFTMASLSHGPLMVFTPTLYWAGGSHGLQEPVYVNCSIA